MNASTTPRLMLVEDERVVALNLQQRLAQLGYEVGAVASSGAEALERASLAWPDLVLMDIRIDGAMDGIETAERLNGIRPVPVVYLTAHSDEATLARARASSPYGYLLKPFSEREMHATIQMALARFEAQETTRRSREQAERMNVELEHRVRERTADLHASLAELEEFCHAVAHDLRAPLRAIEGMGSILLADHAAGLAAEPQRLLRRISDSGQHMARMIDGLLALSRINRGAFVRRPVPLGTVARACAARIAEADPSRTVIFEIADPQPADADPNTVEVVLENLLQNAWKFTAPRQVAHIEFGFRRFPDETVYHVSDDGEGFDMAYVSRLFRPFERLEAGGKVPGEGIGLATVRKIVERHGGRVWAISDPGHGTTIYFTLAPALPAASLEGLPN